MPRKSVSVLKTPPNLHIYQRMNDAVYIWMYNEVLGYQSRCKIQYQTAMMVPNHGYNAGIKIQSKYINADILQEFSLTAFCPTLNSNR